MSRDCYLCVLLYSLVVPHKQYRFMVLNYVRAGNAVSCSICNATLPLTPSCVAAYIAPLSALADPSVVSRLR